MGKKENRWIIGGNHSRAIEENTRFFYHFIQKNHPEIEIIFISRGAIPIRKVRNSDGKAFHNYSLKGLYYIATAKVYFWSISAGDIYFVDPAKVLSVNLFHGMPIKKICYDALNSKLIPAKFSQSILSERFSVSKKNSDLCIATSDFFVPILQSAFRNEKVKSLGLPRNDFLMMQHDDSYIRDLKKELNCEGKKIVSYLPTHRNFGKYSPPLLFEGREENIRSMLGDEYVVLTKQHFHSDNKGSTKYGDTVFNLNKSSITTQELLLITDILITDYSSVFIDYLLLERPILFYCFDLERINFSDLYFFGEEELPGPISTDEASLLKDLSWIKNNREENLGRLKEFKNLFHRYNDSSSSERIYEEVQKMLKKRTN